MHGSLEADSGVCCCGGPVGLWGEFLSRGASFCKKKFKAGLAEKLITNQEGYQLYFCIGGGAELLLNCFYKRHFESINNDFQL